VHSPRLVSQGANSTPRRCSGNYARAAVPCALVALATLGLGGARAPHHGSSIKATGATWEESTGAGSPAIRDRVQHLRLAANGEGWLSSFLNSLFGGEQRSEPRRLRPPRQYRRVPEQGSRRAPRQDTQAPPRELHGVPADATTYRTMCVRLCDGYYWPVSFATLKERFGRDEQACLRSCRSSTALYYYPNPGGDLEDMVSLQGMPYKSLGTAFLHRTTYDASCKCRPHPWEVEAAERHKAYASQPRAVAHGPRRGP
jgi:hypothetical protein